MGSEVSGLCFCLEALLCARLQAKHMMNPLYIHEQPVKASAFFPGSRDALHTQVWYSNLHLLLLLLLLL